MIHDIPALLAESRSTQGYSEGDLRSLVLSLSGALRDLYENGPKRYLEWATEWEYAARKPDGHLLLTIDPSPGAVRERYPASFAKGELTVVRRRPAGEWEPMPTPTLPIEGATP